MSTDPRRQIQPQSGPGLAFDGGWEAGERLLDEDRYEVEVLRASITIEDLAEAIGRQIHATGLTCPDPDHPQSGHSPPAWTYWGGDGIERWKCGRCEIGGDLFDYVQVAEEAADFWGAVDVVAGIVAAAPQPPRPIPSYRTKHPEDPNRLTPVRSPDGLAHCWAYCTSRGWTREGLDLLGPGRWAFMYGGDGDNHGYWLRVYADDRREWWQDRALSGQPLRWRSPKDRERGLFTWEPSYTSTSRHYGQSFTRDHSPALPPLVLVVEGASDFLTAVVAQHWLSLSEIDHRGIAKRFTVVAIPGVGSYRLLDFRDDWAVLLDNDDAGRQARDHIDADQEMPVKHLYVPEPSKDLSDSWAAIALDDFRDGEPPPWERRRSWITQLREALNPPPDDRPPSKESRHG